MHFDEEKQTWPRKYLTIFISIDDNEACNLKSLMDEIFGEYNFVSQVAVQLNPRGRTLDKFLAKTHEYILIYAKN